MEPDRPQAGPSQGVEAGPQARENGKLTLCRYRAFSGPSQSFIHG
jgi:hypothetical protein